MPKTQKRRVIRSSPRKPLVAPPTAQALVEDWRIVNDQKRHIALLNEQLLTATQTTDALRRQIRELITDLENRVRALRGVV